jgi:hypothetical protein
MQQIKGISRKGGYEIGQSLQFGKYSSNSTNAVMTHVFPNVTDSASTRTNTISFWTKLGYLPVIPFSSNREYFFSLFVDTDNRQFLGLDDNKHLWAYCKKGGEVRLNVKTVMQFKDPSAWYHIVQRIDTYDVPEERCQLYANGEKLSLQSHTPTEQNKPLMFFNNEMEHRIGEYTDGLYPVTGCMAEIHATAGNNLDYPPDYFAHEEWNGVYNPIPFEGDYGGNGFYLNFSDTDNLGADSSGNGNDFEETSITAWNALSDTPTNNYCTLNPLDLGMNQIEPSLGNLYANGAGGVTFPNYEGMWYYEIDGSGYTHNSNDGKLWTPKDGMYNFGQRAFANAVPSGQKTLCSKNIFPLIYEYDTSYVGNGSDDGPFVSMFGPPDYYKLNGVAMFPPSVNSQDSTKDWLSNGVKCRSLSNNTNGVTYNITDVSLKQPFKYARGR